MARKSRKNITTMPDIASNLLKTAVYIRLSVEDNKNRGNSVDTQKQIIENFIAITPELEIYDSYIDNGLTLITNSYNNTTQRNDQLLRSQEEKEKRLSVANKITDQKSLTKELVDLLIDQVSVFPNNQIEIAWKIKNFA